MSWADDHPKLTTSIGFAVVVLIVVGLVWGYLMPAPRDGPPEREIGILAEALNAYRNKYGEYPYSSSGPGSALEELVRKKWFLPRDLRPLPDITKYHYINESAVKRFDDFKIILVSKELQSGGPGVEGWLVCTAHGAVTWIDRPTQAPESLLGKTLYEVR